MVCLSDLSQEHLRFANACIYTQVLRAVVANCPNARLSAVPPCGSRAFCKTTSIISHRHSQHFLTFPAGTTVAGSEEYKARQFSECLHQIVILQFLVAPPTSGRPTNFWLPHQFLVAPPASGCPIIFWLPHPNGSVYKSSPSS